MGKIHPKFKSRFKVNEKLPEEIHMEKISLSRLWNQRYSTLKQAPFFLTINNKKVAKVVPLDSGKWYACEKCGVNTQNVFEGKRADKWVYVALCNKCANRYL